MGDVQSLLAAVRFGERDLLRLVDDYGLEELKSYMTDILDTTERLTRAEIELLPQGEWEFTDYIDNDGIDPQPIAIHAKVKIEGGEFFVDFEGTSPQAKGSINPNFAYTKSNVYAVMKCLIDPAIQSNSGFFRPFNITAPEGCFVNPQHPAPVAARGLAGFRICHTARCPQPGAAVRSALAGAATTGTAKPGYTWNSPTTVHGAAGRAWTGPTALPRLS